MYFSPATICYSFTCAVQIFAAEIWGMSVRSTPPNSCYRYSVHYAASYGFGPYVDVLSAPYYGRNCHSVQSRSLWSSRKRVRLSGNIYNAPLATTPACPCSRRCLIPPVTYVHTIRMPWVVVLLVHVCTSTFVCTVHSLSSHRTPSSLHFKRNLEMGRKYGPRMTSKREQHDPLFREVCMDFCASPAALPLEGDSNEARSTCCAGLR